MPDPSNLTAVILYTRPDPVAAGDTPIFESTTTALACSMGRVDALNRLFWATRELTGNDTWVRLRRLHPDHTPDHEWLVHPPPAEGGVAYKCDTASFTVLADGSLLVVMDCHQAVAIAGRKSVVAYALVADAGFALVAGARGELGEGLGVLGAAPPPDPTPGYTLDQIARAVVSLYKAELTDNLPGDVGKLIQRLAQNGATDALVGHGLQLPPFLASVSAFQDALYQDLKDRAFEGAQEALRQAGFPPKGTSPAPQG